MTDHDMSMMPVNGAAGGRRRKTGLGCWSLGHIARAWHHANAALRYSTRPFYSSAGSSQKLGALPGLYMRGRWMNPVPGRSVCR